MSEIIPGLSLAHTQQCAAQHFAPWMIEERWFRAAVEAVKAGTLKPAAMDGEGGPPSAPPYTVHDGVAVIPIAGAIMKAESKFGGTSSVDTRRAIRKAVNDDAVDSILLHIDSPGGTVAGTGDLAADVAAADAVKPVYAHIDDLGASAAYWVASQARRVTANPTGEVGSIGTLLVLEDSSGMYAAKGIKVHVISTGKYKGAGAEGAPVTDEQIAMFQQEVDDLNEHFLKGVSKGRNMPIGQVRSLADGRVHIAAKAKAMGLIDDVATLDEAFAYVGKDKRRMAAGAQRPQPETPRDGGTTNEIAPEEPDPHPSAGGPPSSPLQKEPEMATETVTDAPAQGSAAAPVVPPQNQHPRSDLASLNAEALNAHFERGRQAGIAEGVKREKARAKAIRDACPGKPEMALDAISGEQDAGAVKLAYDATLRAETTAATRIAELEEQNRRKDALLAIGGHAGVGVDVSDEDVPAVDAKAVAEREWDTKPAVRKGFSSKDRYVAFRVRELNGTVVSR